MTETVAVIVAGLSVVVGLIRETQFRRQRGDKITAETSVDEANAANTITETVKGLLIVLDQRLKATQDELEGVRKDLEASRAREGDMQNEIDRLKAQVEILQRQSKTREEQ